MGGNSKQGRQIPSPGDARPILCVDNVIIVGPCINQSNRQSCSLCADFKKNSSRLWISSFVPWREGEVVFINVYPPSILKLCNNNTCMKKPGNAFSRQLVQPAWLLPSALTPSPPPRLNWEPERPVEIALTEVWQEGPSIFFYYSVMGLHGSQDSICHQPRSLITGICHHFPSVLMLSSRADSWLCRGSASDSAHPST